jgi:hypothetical protein
MKPVITKLHTSKAKRIFPWPVAESDRGGAYGGSLLLGTGVEASLLLVELVRCEVVCSTDDVVGESDVETLV